MKRPPIVECEWVDARNVLDECRLSAVSGLTLVRRKTVGFLVHKDETKTILAKDYDAPTTADEEPEVGMFTIIPTGWVLELRPVHVTRERKKAKAAE